MEPERLLASKVKVTETKELYQLVASELDIPDPETDVILGENEIDEDDE